MTVNTAALVGNIGSAPTARTTPRGTPLLEFSLAVDDVYRDDQGRTQRRPNWFRCVIFGPRAEALEKILEQGMKVAVQGKLHQERWEKDGKDMSSVSLTVNDLEIMTKRER